MKTEMVKLEHKGIKFKVARPHLAEIAIASVFAQSPGQTLVQADRFALIPPVGSYWHGEGGINAGYVAARGDVPAHYLIIAAKDIGSLEWGVRGVEVKGLSKTDGYTNTQALIGSDDERKYPAADACAEYQADGHHDFYLPAAAELYQCWLNCPEVFAQDCYYWSSSQRSADYAFNMYFDDGLQSLYAKYDELRVRPVRRFFI